MQILEHKGDNKLPTEYRVLWDNGYVSWGDAKNIKADASKLVKQYQKTIMITK
jgi:hypothetical protein